MTGKIFEYLRCRKPILAVVPSDGVAADLIRQTDSGVIVSSDKVDDIKDKIIDLYHRHKSGQLGDLPHSEALLNYNRNTLTQKLVAECERTF
jgi:hypothetical protein